MESIINENYLRGYAKQYSELISRGFFKDHSTISGEEILGLTPLKQINLFIIKKLMRQWKSETEKLKSPYFNYDNPEVRNALNEFINILSRNIQIRENDLAGLLMDAVSDTLLLIFSPYEFFYKELGHSRKSYSQKDLIENRKFIRINTGLYEAFIDKLEADTKKEYNSEEVKKLFNKVCEEISFDPDDPDPYIEKLTETEPLYLQKIYKELSIGEYEEEQVSTEGNKESQQKESNTVREQFNEPKPSLVDELSKESTDTILYYHQKQKIESIRKNISIHQKFMFVKELFQNDENEFSQVIEFLDKCKTREEALEYLDNNYFNPGLWNDEDEPVIEFMTVIDKKFI